MAVIDFVVQLPPRETFENALLSCLVRHLNGAFTKAIPGIRQGLAIAIREAMESSSEYQELKTGRLWHIMGLENPGPVLESIVNAIIAGIVIDNHGIRVQGSGIAGGLTIRIVRADYGDLLGLPTATFTSTNSEGRNTEVPWLSWLLQEGENLIIADYAYISKPSGYSRTGVGLMVKSKGGWRVPPEFAGTPANNWILRAFETLDEAVANMIVVQIERAMQ